jgi:hypothetical protein
MSNIYDCIRTWHVAKTGNDSNGGHSFTDAKLTIGAAIAAASSGDTIVIWPGTYSGNITVSKSLNFLGTSKYDCIISASSGVCVSVGSAGSGSSFENLSVIDTDTAQFSYAVTLSGSQHIRWTNCYINGANSADAFDICSGGDVYVKNCYIVGAGTAISIATPINGWGVSIEDSTLVGGGCGISMDADDVSLENLKIIVTATNDNSVYGISNTGATLEASNLIINVSNSSTGGNTTLGINNTGNAKTSLTDCVIKVADSGTAATLVAAVNNEAYLEMNNINWSVSSAGSGTATAGLQLALASITTAHNINNNTSGGGTDVAGVKNNGGRATLSNMAISLAGGGANTSNPVIVAGINSTNAAAYTVLDNSSVYIGAGSPGVTTYGLYSTAGKCNFSGVSFDSVAIDTVISDCTVQSAGHEKTQFIDGGSGYPGTRGNDYYNNYLLTWTGGSNTGQTEKVLDWVTSNNEFFFTTGFTNDIQVGDAYTLTRFTYQDIYTGNSGCIVNLSGCNYDPTKVSGIGTVKDYLRPMTFGRTLDVSATGEAGVDLSNIKSGGADEILEKAAKVILNKAVQNKETGAIKFYDDDGETVILTHTPDDGESEITRAPN